VARFPNLEKIGRLAMREEGRFWNAYYALPGTMKDSIFIGSIQMAFVADLRRKQQFMDMMRDCVADILEEQTGVRPTWGGEEIAPEHERTRE
jgi:hypothetical protein